MTSIDLDQELQDRLKVLADKSDNHPDVIMQQAIETYVIQQEQYWLERDEDKQRLDNCRKDGGIPHEEVATWLKTVGTDKPLT